MVRRCHRRAGLSQVASGDVAGGADEVAHDTAMALPERKLEELRRRVEAVERNASAHVKKAEAKWCTAKASKATVMARLDAAQVEAGNQAGSGSAVL